MDRLGFALMVALLRLFSVLPYGLVARLGSALGAALYRLPSRRKHVVLVNLRLCFPTKTERECDDLARDHFRHVVRSYLERGIQWFGSAQSMKGLVEIDSKIDLNDKDAPPTIFMGFHFVAIEVGCIVYSTNQPAASLYTRMSNVRMCDLAKRQRSRFGAEMIERSTSARKIVELLRSGKPVMLAADMDHGIDNSVFVPFFGVPACTLTSVARLARLGRARVVPFVTEVLPNYRGYKLTVFEPLEDFPSGSDAVDTRRMNAFLETQVLKHPEQYYWVHRRFKHRPPGMAGVY
ncbi:lipid A biosynthesis lauroyl acyltransferase [Caballeronia arationis]|uniref:Lauroyl/myristoyl acyltransferase n=1 Tax=Caballeronia arationis TaxID=1777142 RepID=A0A7Z7N6Z5_9BURK|nr:lipid A biosynthesis lauroyl acyltransferase [Caballeronia arationis]SAK97424.1 lipid A biosynthesis lauroyl acyltransferase [Caballeronia arationis]SOE88544.1 Lauroyl/myristoyl acyltransferase [Caballeronia arationis]